MRYFWEDVGKPLLVVVSIIFVFTAVFVKVNNHLEFPGCLVEIEQLRSDVAKVNLGNNENVFNQAVKVNQIIKSRQQYRKLWWSRGFLPAGWDEIEIIDVTTPQKD